MSSSQPPGDGTTFDVSLLDRYLDAVGALDADTALEVTTESVAEYGIDLTVTRLLASAQQEVGRRWEFGDWTVAQEHAATAIVDDCLAVLRRRSDSSPSGPRLVIVCAEGEWHVTPARMVDLRFQELDWQVRFLGGSIPAPHLARTLPLLRADIVAVSCSLPLNLPGARHTVTVAHDLGLPVVAGGAAFDEDGVRAAAVGADAGGESIEELEPQMRRWLDAPPELRVPVYHHPDEVRTLQRQRERTVDLAYADLLAALPGLAEATDEQLLRTHEDLDYIVRFLEVATDMGDPTIFHDFLRWLLGLLAVRGVPDHALAAGLEALEQHLPPGLPHAQELLGAGRERLRSWQ